MPKVSKVFDIDILSPSLPLSIQQIKGMKDLSKVIDGLNIPKQLLDKGEKAFKALFGPSISELAETIRDSFRLR